MGPQHPGWRSAVAVLVAMAGGGCQQLDLQGGAGAAFLQEGPGPEARGAEGPRLRREIEMNRQWQRRPISELVTELGAPRFVMTIPGGGNPPGFAVLYGPDRASGCIDAFALAYGRDPVIRVYHCR